MLVPENRKFGTLADFVSMANVFISNRRDASSCAF